MVGRPQVAHIEAAPRRDLSRRREVRRRGRQVQHRAPHKQRAGSNVGGDWAPVRSVDVVAESTARLNLSSPFSPLLAALADRAGMMVSPKAAQAEGDKFGANPL